MKDCYLYNKIIIAKCGLWAIFDVLIGCFGDVFSHKPIIANAFEGIGVNIEIILC